MKQAIPALTQLNANKHQEIPASKELVKHSKMGAMGLRKEIKGEVLEYLGNQTCERCEVAYDRFPPLVRGWRIEGERSMMIENVSFESLKLFMFVTEKTISHILLEVGSFDGVNV